ncbi:DJ-1/PfpI family protein [bacterium SCSIO 12741]|nr:DJ-1/PfpI family protein [bacterium SCSIO 12741]
MKKLFMLCTVGVMLSSCHSDDAINKSEKEQSTQIEMESNRQSKHFRPLNDHLPTIGLLMYDGVLQGEVVATSDVFAKLDKDGKQLFNVITIAESLDPIVSEEGMTFLPDYSFDNCPKLTALFVPSAYDMHAQVNNQNIIDFIRVKNQEADHMVSNCAGAQLIGKSGVADGHKIVTWIGGGEQLQKDYPKLKVQNDRLISFVEDGKFSSSNGNLASYISALKLLEKMTSQEHREFVESYLYIDQLQDWKE